MRPDNISPTNSKAHLSPSPQATVMESSDRSGTPSDSSQPKVDLSKLSEQEQRLYRLYGRLPSKKDLFQHRMQERKYFDSGDYALKQAGKLADDGPLGQNNLPVTNPSGLRESIIRRRLSSSAGDSVSRKGSISSGPPPRSPGK